MTPALLATCAGPMLLDFGEASIRALRDGRKTETRTVIKINETGENGGKLREIATSQIFGTAGIRYDLDNPRTVRLRYHPGKRYYVDEVWAQEILETSIPTYFYRSDGSATWAKWRSPICMPRAAARYVVEVTGSRVERLQAIAEDGARAEGFFAVAPSSGIEFSRTSARCAFREAWDARHKRAPWAINPFVEVSTIRVVTG